MHTHILVYLDKIKYTVTVFLTTKNSFENYMTTFVRKYQKAYRYGSFCQSNPQGKSRNIHLALYSDTCLHLHRACVCHSNLDLYRNQQINNTQSFFFLTGKNIAEKAATHHSEQKNVCGCQCMSNVRGNRPRLHSFTILTKYF